eukprot:scaffold75222_cov36-Cyclotella_meneghiniana.AAC.3
MPVRQTTYPNKDNIVPVPPEGGWIKATVGSELGTKLIRYLSSGCITALQDIKPKKIWLSYPEF